MLLEVVDEHSNLELEHFPPLLYQPCKSKSQQQFTSMGLLLHLFAFVVLLLRKTSVEFFRSYGRYTTTQKNMDGARRVWLQKRCDRNGYQRRAMLWRALHGFVDK